jgi:hypothetical protein
MSWYNPVSWFGSDTDETIVAQSAHDVLLLAQARADHQAGLISDADYQALRAAFHDAHGAAALDAFDASEPDVPAGATIAEIKTAIEIGEIDPAGLELAVSAAQSDAQGKVDAIYDNAVKKAVTNPLAVIPAWVKWAALAAVILYALSTLARLGVRVPRPSRR